MKVIFPTVPGARAKLKLRTEIKVGKNDKIVLKKGQEVSIVGRRGGMVQIFAQSGENQGVLNVLIERVELLP